MRAQAGALGSESWARAQLLGMEATLPVSLDWQSALPEVARVTGWARFGFGIQVLDMATGIPLQGNYVWFRKTILPSGDDFLVSTRMTIEGWIIEDLEGASAA